MKKLLLLLVFFCFYSCGILPKKNNDYYSFKKVEVGAIGFKDKAIRKTNFTTEAIPFIKKPIRLAVLTGVLQEKELIKYNKIYKQNQKKVSFLEIFIYDKQAYIDNILEEKNKNIYTYLYNRNLKVVNSIKIIINKNIQSSLKKSDDYYLEMINANKPVIAIYTNGKRTGVLDISENMVFAYQLDSFCWGQKKNKKIEIVSLTTEGTKCKKPLEESYSKLKEELITKIKF